MAKTAVTTDPKRLKQQARDAALRRLIDSHGDEFRTYMVEEHEARGVEYKPRLSPAERAVREVQRLASEHPEVKQALADGLVG